MKIETHELTGFILDYCVAQALGFVFDVDIDETHGYKIIELIPDGREIRRSSFNPSLSGNSALYVLHCLMREYKVTIFNGAMLSDIIVRCSHHKLREPPRGNPKFYTESGLTLDQAACRCYVLRKLGPMVDVPEHYVNFQISRDLKLEIEHEARLDMLNKQREKNHDGGVS